MKELLEKILQKLSELVSHHKQQLIPIPDMIVQDRWIDQRTTMHMTMRGERQLARYVQDGLLKTKKIGRSNVYLESSILAFILKSNDI